MGANPASNPVASSPAAQAAAEQASPSATTSRLQAYVSPARPIDVAPWQKVGSPYQINGLWYIPAHEPDYDEVGTARVYAPRFQGRRTANGEVFDSAISTAAHPTLPIPSEAMVTNLENGRSMLVRINDRGPFAGGALINLSARAADLLGIASDASARVRVTYFGQADAQAPRAAPRPASTPQRPSQPRPAGLQTAEATPPARPAPTPRQSPPRNPAPRTAPARAAEPGGGLFVQIGAFATRANADRAARSARELGTVRVVEPQAGATSPLYRVLVGPFRDRGDAEARLAVATEAGLGGRVITVVERETR